MKQLSLFDSDRTSAPSAETLVMSREELLRWKERIYRHQQGVRLAQKNKPRQQVLLDLPQSTLHEPDDIEPLKLKLYPADFYRRPRLEVSDGQGCLYFLVDHFAELVLYIGETKLSAYQRWIGTHYAKDYTLNYIELHRRYDLECAVCCAFWFQVPPDKKVLREWERELIFKWRSPFNRQMWESYGQPFKRF